MYHGFCRIFLVALIYTLIQTPKRSDSLFNSGLGVLGFYNINTESGAGGFLRVFSMGQNCHKDVKWWLCLIHQGTCSRKTPIKGFQQSPVDIYGLRYHEGDWARDYRLGGMSSAPGKSWGDLDTSRIKEVVWWTLHGPGGSHGACLPLPSSGYQGQMSQVELPIRCNA